MRAGGVCPRGARGDLLERERERVDARERWQKCLPRLPQRALRTVYFALCFDPCKLRDIAFPRAPLLAAVRHTQKNMDSVAGLRRVEIKRATKRLSRVFLFLLRAVCDSLPHAPTTMPVYLVDHAAYRPPALNNVNSFEMADKGEEVFNTQKGCPFLEKHPVVSVLCWVRRGWRRASTLRVCVESGEKGARAAAGRRVFVFQKKTSRRRTTPAVLSGGWRPACHAAPCGQNKTPARVDAGGNGACAPADAASAARSGRRRVKSQACGS